MSNNLIRHSNQRNGLVVEINNLSENTIRKTYVLHLNDNEYIKMSIYEDSNVFTNVVIPIGYRLTIHDTDNDCMISYVRDTYVGSEQHTCMVEQGKRDNVEFPYPILSGGSEFMRNLRKHSNMVLNLY